MTEAQRSVLHGRISHLIRRLADGSQDPGSRDALLDEVQVYQRRNVAAYGRLFDQHSPQFSAPAMPTDVFRYVRVSGHPESQDIALFRTSGTTGGQRGQHALRDLSLYDLAAKTAARYAMFPEAIAPKLIILAPPAAEAPDSSLSYMLQKFVAWFGGGQGEFVVSQNQVNVEKLTRLLRECEADGQPVALLGTSFAFVFADEALKEARFGLPPGSRIMQTGGFKGRTKTLSSREMYRVLIRRFGVPQGQITQEYGMTELSSQMYGAGLRHILLGDAKEAERTARAFWVPGWVRVTPVSPETLRPVAPGETGILRIDDLANLDSVSAIQTSDRARVTNSGLELLGRAPGAVPRGCSLAIEEALGGEP